MRLRRVEFVIIGVTLAFVCFMGGFFTGRNLSTVNLMSVSAGGDETGNMSVQVEFEIHTETPEQPTGGSEPGNATQQVSPESTPQPMPQQTPQNELALGAPMGGDGKININTASQTELTDLPGIGNTISSRIVDYRQRHGEFRSIEDIMNVSGIGEKRFEAIAELITVG